MISPAALRNWGWLLLLHFCTPFQLSRPSYRCHSSGVERDADPFCVSVSSLDSGADNTLSKFMDNSKLGQIKRGRRYAGGDSCPSGGLRESKREG